MEANFKPKMLRSISVYLSKSFKFYDIKGGYVAPLFFVLILAVSFFSYYSFTPGKLDFDITKPENIERLKLISSQMIFVFFVTNIIRNLISNGYLYAYVKELKGESYSLGECVKVTCRNSFKLVMAYIAVSLYVPAYIIALKLPGILSYIVLGILLLTLFLFLFLYLMLIFSRCYIQDKNMSFISSLKSSIRLSKGHKVEIFSIILIIKFISFMLMFFSMSFVSAPGNELVQVFVESFMGTIFTLVEVRIVSMIYFDLEY